MAEIASLLPFLRVDYANSCGFFFLKNRLAYLFLHYSLALGVDELQVILKLQPQLGPEILLLSKAVVK